MNKKFVVIFLLLAFNALLAQNSEKQIQSVINKIYNFNFDKAETELNDFIKKYPDDHRGYYYKSVINLWFYLGSLSEAHKDSFEFYSDKSKSVLVKTDNDKQSDLNKKLFWTGLIEYNNSVASARANDFANAILSLNNMRKSLQEVIQSNPEFYDAYLPIGLSNFAFAEVPAALKWAANLVGFNSDKELGLQYLQLVSEKGKILKTDAQFYLSQIYSRVIIEQDEAEKILSKLTKSFKGNLLFNYSYAWIKFQQNDLTSSEKIIRSILSSDNKNFPYVISNSHLLLANIFFVREKYDSALAHYDLFRNFRVNNDYLGFANLRTGYCLEMLGNRNKAIKYYEQTDEGNKDIDEDIYAEKSGKTFIQKPIGEEFKLFQHVRNLIKQNKSKEAEAILNDILADKNSSNKSKSESYLLLSEIFLNGKNYEDALEYAKQSLRLNNKDNTISAFADYNAAVALVNLNRQSEAISYLDKIENADEFDFQSTLKNKAYTLRRKILIQQKSD
jgi:tetratricopeptide (TPR) repeat protein